MELLDRYLQAVRRYLPLRRQDDIIAELRANMESQIEDREGELGRPLTQGEFEDLLRKMGPPVVVASRYQPQQYLIGPTIFPLYFYVLRVALLWAFIVSVIVSAVVLPLTMKEPVDIADSLFRIPAVLVQVAGWVTLVFAVFEFISARYPQLHTPIEGMTKMWHPNSLPPLEKQTGPGKPRSYVTAVAEVVFGALFLGWILLIPKHPFLLMGPGFLYLRVSPFLISYVWWSFYWWIVGLNVLQLGWKTIDLIFETWQRPARIQAVVFKVVGLVPLVMMLTAPNQIYVMLKDSALDQARYGQTLDQVNNAIHLGFAVVTTIVVLQLAFDIGRWVLDAYRDRMAAAI